MGQVMDTLNLDQTDSGHAGVSAVEQDDYADEEALAALQALNQDDGSEEEYGDGVYYTPEAEPQIVEAKQYSNRLARIFDSIGKALGDNFAGNWLRDVASKIEAKYGVGETREAFQAEIEGRSYYPESTLSETDETQVQSDGGSVPQETQPVTPPVDETVELQADAIDVPVSASPSPADQAAALAALNGNPISSETGLSDVSLSTEELMACMVGEDMDGATLLNGVSQMAESYRLGLQDPDSMLGRFSSGLQESVEIDPVQTGQVLVAFRQTVLNQIDTMEGLDESSQAAARVELDTAMMGLSESYYNSVFQYEASGHVLTDEQRAAIDGLVPTDLSEGAESQLGSYVGRQYSSFIPSGTGQLYSQFSLDASPMSSLSEEDIQRAGVYHDQLLMEGLQRQTLQTEDATEIARCSDGHLSEGLSEAEYASDEVMRSSAREAVYDNSMFLTGDASEKSDFDTVRLMFQEKASAMRTEYVENSAAISDPEQLQQVTASSYMTMMRGVQVYNDTAYQAIQEKYAGDPEGMEMATQGLAKTMRAMVGNAWDMMQNDDSALGFLSEADRQELDRMQFTGVNVLYSNYQPGMNLKTGMVNGAAFTLHDEADLESLMASGSWYSDDMLREYGDADMTYQPVAEQPHATVQAEVSAPAAPKEQPTEQATKPSRYEEAMSNPTLAAAMRGARQRSQQKAESLGLFEK